VLDVGRELGTGPVPGEPAPDREREPVGPGLVGHRRGDGGQPATLGEVDERGEGRLVGGQAVVVTEPDPVGAHGQGVQHPEREATRPAEVRPGRDPRGRQVAAVDDRFRGLVGTVVDDDQVCDRMGLLRERGERLRELLVAVAGDHHRDDRSCR
jgi:hypothetical protein